MGIRSTLGALGSPKGRKSPERRSLRDSVSFRLFLIAVLFLHGRKDRIGGFAGQGTICGSKSVYSRQVVVSEKKYWALEMWINVWNSGGYSQTYPDSGRQLLSGPKWFAGSGNPLEGGLLRNLYFSEMERARNAIAGQRLLSISKGPPGRPRVVASLSSFSREIR